MWESILKLNNPHGIHVTKMYMFLKRWAADEHTDQFKNTYWTLKYYNETDSPGSGFRHTKWYIAQTLRKILGDANYDADFEPKGWVNGEEKRTIPGIRVIHLDEHNIELEFDDAKHMAGREEYIEGSSEKRRENDGERRYSWQGESPYDEELQSAWETLQRRLKKTQNRRGV